METLTQARQTTPSAMRIACLTAAQHTLPEEVWGLLMPTQQQAVLQIIVHLCRQMMEHHQNVEEAHDEQG
jgi:hypothetical protein